MATSTLSPDRPAWRSAVAEIADKAKAKLPECTGRIDSALKIVLAGDVELLQEGGARVASRSDGRMVYHLANGRCDCKDYPRAPGQLCAHRLAYGIAKRATALTQQRLEAQAESPTPAPVASGTAPIPQSIPPQFIVELHGKQFVTFSGLLTLAHEKGLASLKADFITVTAELALAHAVATFTDGRSFEESADATPSNVNPKIRPHFPRLALTRAKARALCAVKAA